MFKANGREKRSKIEEHAGLKGKTFVCPDCESTRVILGVEFGEQVMCNNCKINMKEKEVKN